MRRLVLFLAIVGALCASAAVFDWWVDPFGQVWKPDAMNAARSSGCLVSEELIGSRYWSFKRDVFFHRPTRTFVVGSSRVLKIEAPDASFANLGYPGSSPETILRLFRSLPAKPVQTVYLGVEAFWFNAQYTLPATDLSRWRVLEYLLARKTFTRAVTMSHESESLPQRRWKRETVGGQCVLDRFTATITWRTDGSRVWGWELDPAKYPPFAGGQYEGDLTAWRNGYYAGWTGLDRRRIAVLGEALDLARARGWHVVGFAPPEPASALPVLDRLRPWHAFRAAIPKLFAVRGFTWVDTIDGAKLGCRRADFPDLFHTNARCSTLLRAALTAAHRT